ncbi:MAG: CHAT domain-containing protein [Flavobacteriales bacterium]
MLRPLLFAGVLLLAALASGQYERTILKAEKALCLGDDMAAERATRDLLANPLLDVRTRFDALILLATVADQREDMERFLALTDSAASLLGPSGGTDQEARAHVEVNRSRYAFFVMQYERAELEAQAALARYRRAPDRSQWRFAFRIHQTLATAYRIKPASYQASADARAADMFAHFDTALVMVRSRKDLPTYWEASVWRAVSNALMDQMGRPINDHERYAERCREAQLHALTILQREYPRNRLARVALMNLHGLYLVYHNEPASAFRWFSDAQHLIAGDIWQAHDRRFVPAWLTALRWKAMVFESEPWRSDTSMLQLYLDELQDAELLFTRYATGQATAMGLFTRDRYGYAPFSASLATCQRLWELTGEVRYIDHALRSAEKVRRDEWNTAQSIRGRSELMREEPPLDMLVQVRRRMNPDDGLLLCVDYGLGQVAHRVITLALTRDSLSFRQCRFNSDWSCALDMPQPLDAKLERRALNLLHDSIYAPARHVLHGHQRLYVFATNEMAKLSFDALLADTASADIRHCHPLVLDHAISYPYFLLPSGLKSEEEERGTLFLAPRSGSGSLTDLRLLRAAMAQWRKGPLAGLLDSSVTTGVAALQRITQAGTLVWGGHCGGNGFLGDEPMAYLTNSMFERTAALLPSELLALHAAPSFVIHAACRSGSFYPYGNSGSVSFARAFLFVGSRTVVAAQNVADEASSIKIIDFLLNALADGVPKDIALQRAKLAYLEQAPSAEQTRPLYWATWQVWGEANAVQRKGSGMTWYTWLLLLGGTITMALGIHRFRKIRALNRGPQVTSSARPVSRDGN